MNVIEEIFEKTKKFWKAPTKMTVSQWADNYRVLSPESSAEPGKWLTDRAPYQRGMMDAICDPRVETVVFMTASQIGKTEIINNIIGYFIDQEPCPILLVMPTLEMGQAWSKDRFAPMLRDTPVLKGKVKDVKSKSSGNTIMHKVFEGGHITISGANSPASLASRPIRIVLCDEIDRYPLSAGPEGDPVNLAFKRATTFWNRKKIVTSTPTIHGVSRIEQFWEMSDKRRYYVPCPHCGEYQVLQWKNVSWPKKGNKYFPEHSVYICEYCKKQITDADIPMMLQRGEWRAEAPFTGIAGFHINELYSPWVSFADTVKNFLDAKKTPETLKVWVNTALGEPWEEGEETIDDDTLLARREKYPEKIVAGKKIPLVPEEVIVLTAGVDVQDDRIEVEVAGWGIGEESWNIDYKVFYGDPAREGIWKQLDEYLQKVWEHQSGIKMRISSVCIDTGGHHTQQVYKFVKPRQIRRVWAIKGINQPGRPVVGRPSKNNSLKVKLFPIGTDTAKELIFTRLKIDEFGYGYMHFPLERDEEYFKQLTAERPVSKFVRGKQTRVWVKTRARNEALDCRIYALAALYILNPNLEKISQRLEEKIKEEKEKNSEKDEQKQQKKKIKRVKKKGTGFVNKWRL